MKILFSLAVAMAVGTPVLSQDAGDRINQLRSESGHAPVRLSPALQAAAEAHARDMAKHGYFSHQGRDGSNHTDRARRHGFGRCYLNENIAMVAGGFDGAMSQWMTSSAHRKNLLNRKAEVYGLGTASGNIWVLMMGEDC